MSGASPLLNNTRLRKKIIPDEPDSDRKQKNLSIKKVSGILKKREEERTSEENEFLYQSEELAKEAASRLKKRELLKQREVEFEDTDEQLEEKCARLAEAVRLAEYLVVYTGAGISTAARIPDYRGTSGIWTLLQQGKDIGEHDLTQAEPTYTHMALAEMHHRGRLKHIVSQNCDGLHLRSGLSRTALSEVHGNMFIEVCRTCRPFREYLRLFDVTENTARFSHQTQRRCYRCQSPLTDSIVHFGERGNLPWPLNWKGACRAAENADVILCMGSSLKVLKKYPWLWGMDKPARRRPKLYIVNLQWTPKDCGATIKIHGKCDAVMKRLARFLNLQVPDYRKERDPIFVHATRLCADEEHTTTRRALEPPEVPLDVDAPKDSPTPTKVEVDSSEKEVIVITVESDPPACCDAFATPDVTHDVSCSNFVLPSHDVPVVMAPEFMSPPQFTVMEAMFFNYLYTLISTFGSYPQPALPTPMPSTSSRIDGEGPPEKRPKVEPPITVKCSFCTKQYQSEFCLFYLKCDAVFEENSSACLCCGDEEDDSESDSARESDKEGEKRVNNDAAASGDEKVIIKSEPKCEEDAAMVKQEEAAEEGSEMRPEKDIADKQKSSVNPGWYGKGYRKRVKKKR